jgi:hypothetical protein
MEGLMETLIGTIVAKYGVGLGINGLMFVVVLILVWTNSKHLNRMYKMQGEESQRQFSILKGLLDENRGMRVDVVSRLVTLQILIEKGIACPFLRDNYEELLRELKEGKRGDPS